MGDNDRDEGLDHDESEGVYEECPDRVGVDDTDGVGDTQREHRAGQDVEVSHQRHSYRRAPELKMGHGL